MTETATNLGREEECDYLVVGGGASGMAFSDTLLRNSPDPNLRVIVVDQHDTPGGQWHDSYQFVQLHQPSTGYGVESTQLEPPGDGEHRASRSEILHYYANVARDLQTAYNFEFWGRTTLDLSQLYERNPSRDSYDVVTTTIDAEGIKTQERRNIKVRRRLVDARNLEPDLPVTTPPKFDFDGNLLSVVPLNDVANTEAAAALGDKKHFVVVGGGKTGMDAVFHLLTEKKVPLEDLLWIVPNDAWITARENIGNCIDLLHTSAQIYDMEGNHSIEEKKESDSGVKASLDAEFFQRGFLEWEQQGHIYRLDSSIVPTKFKDATLSRNELEVLKTTIPRMLRRGRIRKIEDNGTMVFADGSTHDLPFPTKDTLFLHCSAGAFHCSKSQQTPFVFQDRIITVQDIYGTPGYCFVASMIGKLESMDHELSDSKKNAMALFPKQPPPSEPSGGDVLGSVTLDHPWIQRAHNLKLWLDHPKISEWIFRNRLFHMADHDPEVVANRVQYIFQVLQNAGIQ